MLCKNCGYELNSEILFCPKCGTKAEQDSLRAGETVSLDGQKLVCLGTVGEIGIDGLFELLENQNNRNSQKGESASYPQAELSGEGVVTTYGAPIRSIPFPSDGVAKSRNSEAASRPQPEPSEQSVVVTAYDAPARQNPFAPSGKPLKNNSDSEKRVIKGNVESDMDDIHKKMAAHYDGEFREIKWVIDFAADHRLNSKNKKKIKNAYSYTEEFSGTRIGALRAYENILGSMDEENERLRQYCAGLWEELAALRTETKQRIEEFIAIAKSRPIGGTEAEYQIKEFSSLNAKEGYVFSKIITSEKQMLENILYCDFNTKLFEKTIKKDKMIRLNPKSNNTLKSVKGTDNFIKMVLVLSWIMFVILYTKGLRGEIELFLTLKPKEILIMSFFSSGLLLGAVHAAVINQLKESLMGSLQFILGNLWLLIVPPAFALTVVPLACVFMAYVTITLCGCFIMVIDVFKLILRKPLVKDE